MHANPFACAPLYGDALLKLYAVDAVTNVKATRDDARCIGPNLFVELLMCVCVCVNSENVCVWGRNTMNKLSTHAIWRRPRRPRAAGRRTMASPLLLGGMHHRAEG